MALLMALLLCFSMFVSFGTTAQAAGERSEIYMVSFPRDAESNRDHWDRDNLQFMNGWYMEAYDMFATFAVGSYEGKVAYCIEPGTPIDNGHTFTAKDETFWDNYPSSLNKTIDARSLGGFCSTATTAILTPPGYLRTAPQPTNWLTSTPRSS